MAQNVVVELIDDLDGTPAEETIPFAIDGKSYEIDLSKRNAAALRKALDRYIQAGRRAASGSRKRSAIAGPSNYGEARAWAAEKNIDVPQRGRLNRDFMEAFEKGDVAAAKRALK